MSAKAMTWVWGMFPRYRGKPDTLAKSMLFYLSVCANESKRHGVWRSEETMLRDLCCGLKPFRARKKALVEQGYVVIEERRHPTGARKGQRTTDMWLVQVDRPADPYEKAQPPPHLKRGRATAAIQREPDRRRRSRLQAEFRRNYGGKPDAPPSDPSGDVDLATPEGTLSQRPPGGRAEEEHMNEEQKKKNSSYEGTTTALRTVVELPELPRPGRAEETKTDDRAKTRRRPIRRPKSEPALQADDDDDLGLPTSPSYRAVGLDDFRKYLRQQSAARAAAASPVEMDYPAHGSVEDFILGRVSSAPKGAAAGPAPRGRRAARAVEP